MSDERLRITEEDLRQDENPILIVTENDIEQARIKNILREFIQRMGQLFQGRVQERSPFNDPDLMSQIIFLRHDVEEVDGNILAQLESVQKEIDEAGKAITMLLEDESPLISEMPDDIAKIFMVAKNGGRLTDAQLSKMNNFEQELADSGADDEEREIIVTLLDGTNQLSKSEKRRQASREKKEAMNAQLKFIRQHFTYSGFVTPIDLLSHYPQKYHSHYYSCVIASVRNALIAMQVDPPAEDIIIEKMGGKDKLFDSNGFVALSQIKSYLNEYGIKGTSSGNIVELITCLKLGGVAVLAFEGHAKLISKAYYKNNKIFFKVHDPMNNTKPEEISDEDMVRAINSSSDFLNLVLLLKFDFNFLSVERPFV